MIISDLQHIESATETEVQGGCRWCAPPKPPDGKRSIRPPMPIVVPDYPCPYNAAGAEAGAQAFGSSTITSTTTDTLVIQGQFSGSTSSSFAAAY